VLEQVVNCKDTIAQQYLMECVIQVFPLEYHVATLKPYLEHAGYLSVGADVKALPLNRSPKPEPRTQPNPNPSPDLCPDPGPKPNPKPPQALLICLMERLSQWAAPDDEPEEDNVFALLSAQVTLSPPLVTTPSHHP
jgi:hypothetical protein